MNSFFLFILFHHFLKKQKKNRIEPQQPPTLDSIIRGKFIKYFGDQKDDQIFPPVNRTTEISSFWFSNINNLIKINTIKDDTMKSIETSFTNSRYGSGKTSFSRIVLDFDYLKRHKELIVTQITKFYEENGPCHNALKVLLKEWKDGTMENCILLKLFDNFDDCVGPNGIDDIHSIVSKLIEKILGFFSNFLAEYSSKFTFFKLQFQG